MHEQCYMSMRMVCATCQMMVGMDVAMKYWQKSNTVRRGVMQCMHDMNPVIARQGQLKIKGDGTIYDGDKEQDVQL